MKLWSYNTGGAWLVGRILEKATGMTIAQYLETRLWSRFAMESDGVWEALVKGQVDMGGHGFNATLRDWGRFALFVAGGGKLPSGQELLPEEWIEQSVAWSTAKRLGHPGNSARPVWIPVVVHRGRSGRSIRMMPCRPPNPSGRKGSIGQAIAINRSQKLVMVQWSTWNEADTRPSLYDEQALFFNALAHALKVSGAVAVAL